MSFTKQHASALSSVRAKGAAVTFTGITRTTDASAGTSSVTSTTVPGFAIQTKGDPRRYERLNLIESEAPTLLFVATDYGDSISPGMKVTWNGTAWIVRDVQPTAPDGTVILSKVVISR